MKFQNINDIANEIMVNSQIAASLEVSATPKPGNVHRYSDFELTRYEHFLAGSIALGPSIRKIARRGVLLSRGLIDYDEIGIGRCLSESISDIQRWHKGGNTHLGILLLFAPLSAAAGIYLRKGRKFILSTLRRELEKVINSTTNHDAKLFSKALASLDLSWLGLLSEDNHIDINSGRNRNKNGIEVSFYELMQLSRDWDGIARELTNGLNLVFNIGYPNLIKTYNETEDINISIVNTYLALLSESPDTFIARKVGLERTNNIREAVEIGMPTAIEISDRAKTIMDEYDGLKTQEGRAEINRLDSELRNKRNPINPGTTADITAASIMTVLLSGFKI